jgi:hypothetical protein
LQRLARLRVIDGEDDLANAAEYVAERQGD